MVATPIIPLIGMVAMLIALPPVLRLPLALLGLPLVLVLGMTVLHFLDDLASPIESPSLPIFTVLLHSRLSLMALPHLL